ncbi:hypothetical protein GF337_09015 [candidate division KSB1 bacterium]|nr:hypothetical protein [candidate division KSB1 bacterium]
MKKLAVLIFTLAISAFVVEAKNITIVDEANTVNFELLDVEIEGNLMIVTGGLGGAGFYDISDPLNPEILSSFELKECAWGRSYNWDIDGNLAIGTARECGMAIYDIAVPKSPVKKIHFNPDENAFSRPDARSDISLEDVEIENNYAAFAAHTDGLVLYNIFDSSNPKFLSQIKTTNAFSLALENKTAYVADGDGGIRIIDLTNPTSPRLLGSHSTSGSARDIRYRDGRVFVAVGAAGVDVFNVEDPNNPVFLDNYATLGFASRVTIHESGNLISVSAWDYLEVLQWNDRTLESAGFKDTGGRVMAVGTPGGNFIYSAEWERLRIMEYGEINGPDLDIMPRSLNFPRLSTGQSDTLPVLLTNNGNQALIISLIQSSHQDFTTFPDINRLEPNESVELNIVYSANATNAGGRLNIYSTDPDEGITSVKLQGNRQYSVDVNVPAPDFELPFVINGSGTLKLSELKGQIVVLAFFGSW